MEKIRSYKEQKSEEKKNYKNEEIKEDKNIKHSKKYFNRRCKYKNKEKSYTKNSRTTQNSKSKNNPKRIYNKRTDLIQERIKILQLAKKNIEEEDENNTNIIENISDKEVLTDKENNLKDTKNIKIKENNVLFNSMKLEGIKNDNSDQNNLEMNNRYIKKIPEKIFENSGKKNQKIFKKYQTSTFIYKKDNKGNEMKNNENNIYNNNNTYKQDKEIGKKSKEKTIINEIDLIGRRTGFICQNKKMENKIDLKSSGDNSYKNIRPFIFIKAKSKKKYQKINLLIKSENNIKESKADLDNDKETFINKEKDLKNIYIPKKVHHLIRGNSQENMHNLNQYNYTTSNITLKNRYKSYKKINNLINKSGNNNINININNNIKIITYNKKKPSWKMDKKDDDIKFIEDKIEEEKFDIFQDNISDISSIESRSNIESETTENNNKLNVYLNNIYKTKSIFHPKLYKKKQNNTIMDKGINNMKYSLNTQKINEIKNSRNSSVPHFIFKKRITQDISEYKNKSNLNNNNQIKNNVKSIKMINNENNEIKFEEFVILEGKLKNIIDGIDKNSTIINKLCFDFLNNFNESSFLSIVEKLFENKNLKIIKIYLKYLLFSIELLYNYTLNSPIEENDKFLIQEMFSLNLQNILHLYEYIISKVKSKNPWADTVKTIIHNYKRFKKNLYSSSTNINYHSIFDKIKNNTKYIRQIINRIFSSNKRIDTQLISFLKELENKSFNEIKNYFNEIIFKPNKIYGYIYPFNLFGEVNKEFNQNKNNFQKKEISKKNTLFLGLEEILLNLEIKGDSKSKGNLQLRPGLNSFLKEISNYYEIIIFSLSEKAISDYLMNSIEKRNKFIDLRLYRENLKIDNNEFVIDLNEFCRPIDKVIIVSNIPQIGHLHKKNFINIKSYWEEDLKDNILNYLMNILKNIAQEEGDVVDLLLKYRNDIIKNITIGSFQ